VNADVKARVLEVSPALVADGLEVHTMRVRDLRERFGDEEVYVAECSCGWTGTQHSDITAARTARREGLNHVNAQGPAYGHAPREGS